MANNNVYTFEGVSESCARSIHRIRGEEVEKYVLHCPECQKSRNTPPDYPLQNWPITSSPWERVHVDFAGPVKEQYYLLMQCAASKWPEPAIETSDTTYEKNDKERNSDDATRNDLEQPAENLASTEKIVTETLGSNTDANLQQENGPHNDSNQAMTVLRQSERKRTRLERFGASWPW
ncbi:hypothetical protein GJ496_006640 [Pomphorhynchus laevis]|nr:hypothetical protein GJ496_006640 [Pomphorhynchus laevis]